MNETLREFTQLQTFAVVGASQSKRKFGTAVYRTLRERGLTAYPVNPRMTECEGAPCFPSLRELPEPVEAAVVVVRPEQAMKVVDDAEAAGIRRLWFQQGADFSNAAAEAARRGMAVVTGKCILMYAGEVTGPHRVHRFINRLFGRY